MASQSREKAGMKSSYTKSGSKSGMFGKLGAMGKLGGFSNKSNTIKQKQEQKKYIDEMLSMFKKDTSIKDVDTIKTAAGIGFNLNKEFQKAKFFTNPMTGQLKTKGWELSIPDTFKKVMSGEGVNKILKYVAPIRTYTSRYNNPSERGEKTKRSTGTYVPTEIILDPITGKLKRVIKRGTYKTDEERDDSGREYRRKVYTKEIQDYDKGVLQKRKVWDDFVSREKEYDDRGYNRDRDIYLQAEYDYNPFGRLMMSKIYDDYVGSGRTGTTSQFKSDTDVQDWATKRRAEIYSTKAQGKSLSGVDYQDYLKNPTSQKSQQLASDARILRSLNQDTMAQLSKEYAAEQAKARSYSKTKRSTALRSVNYYDEWGQPIETVRLW